jgi:hypothetical protein
MIADIGDLVRHKVTGRTGRVVNCPGYVPMNATCVDFGGKIEEVQDGDLDLISKDTPDPNSD